MYDYGFGTAMNIFGGAVASLDNGWSSVTFKLVFLIAIVWGLASCFFGFKVQRVITAIMSAITLGAIGGVATGQAVNGPVG